MYLHKLQVFITGRYLSHRVTLYLITTICTVYPLTAPVPGDQVPVSVAGPHTGQVVLTGVRVHPGHHLTVQPRPLLLHPVPVRILGEIELSTPENRILKT